MPLKPQLTPLFVSAVANDIGIASGKMRNFGHFNAAFAKFLFTVSSSQALLCCVVAHKQRHRARSP